MDQKIPYDDYQLPVVFLPSYENPPAWIAPQDRIHHPDYNNELTQFLPRTVVLKKPPGAQLGFNIRGGKASQLGIFISKVVPDSDAHRAGLQEGDQVLSVNDVDFQDIEHSRAVEILKTAREIVMRVRFFPYSECFPRCSPAALGSSTTSGRRRELSTRGRRIAVQWEGLFLGQRRRGGFGETDDIGNCPQLLLFLISTTVSAQPLFQTHTYVRA
ncbi:PDZ domain-containing protein 11-like [Scleropages formosus]|uniref:PDZ domain-containing protein 11 n=1 Tax=Scleropages formosus TaxID=113540 RepID=A0A0P7TUT5_SCLFO|nr:PDZ domain-containing protein 11-like [Scleropages formosus]